MGGGKTTTKPETPLGKRTQDRKNAKKVELYIEKFVKKSIQRRRVNPGFKHEKLVPPPEPLYIRDVNEKTLFFNA